MSWFSNLSLRDRFLIVPIISAITALVLYVVTSVTFQSHSSEIQKLLQIEVQHLNRAHQYSNALNNLQYEFTQVLSSESNGNRENVAQQLVTLAKDIGQWLDQVESLVQPAHENIMLSARRLLTQYQSAQISQLRPQQTTNQLDQENAPPRVAARALFQLNNEFQAISDALQQNVKQRTQQLDQELVSHNMIFLVTILFIVIIGIVSGYIAKRMSTDLQQINRAMIHYANGDLHVELPHVKDHYLSRVLDAATAFKATLQANRQQNEQLDQKNQQLQLTNERYLSFLNMTTTAILAINDDHEIVLFNKAAEKVFGYQHQEVVGQKLDVLLPTELRRHHDHLISSFQTSHEQTLERAFDKSVQGVRKNGETFLMKANIAKLSIGKETLMTASIEDITSQSQVQAALADSQHQQKSILNNTSSIIYVKDLDGKYLFINRVFENLFDIIDSEVKGKTDFDIFPAEIAQSFRANDLRVIENNGLIEMEEVVHVNNIERTYLSTKYPLSDRNGKLYALSGISVDITELKRTERNLIRSEARFRSLFQSAVVGIIVANESTGLIEEWNSGAQKIFGYIPQEIIRRPILDLLAEESKQSKRSHFFVEFEQDAVASGATHELVGQRKNGESFPVAVTLSNWKESDQGHFSVIVLDITARKAAEEQLREYRDHLEEMIEERTQELQESFDHLTVAQEQLVESEKMAALGGLVAGISHEINTPIGIGVTAASHLLDVSQEFAAQYKKGELTEDNVELQIKTNLEVADILLSNMHRAANLIQSFKQVAVDQSSEAARTFELSQYLEEILTSLKPKFKNKPYSVHINCPEGITLQSVPGALAQVFTNLLMNSLIHGFDGRNSGTIDIQVSTADQDVIIDYQDDGKGIPSGNLEHIFEPFFTTKRSQGGSGLGMHIVYSLVTETLAGSISCQSEPDQGTQFNIRIPMALAQEQSKQTAATNTQSKLS